MKPHLYTLSPERPFLATLARGLVEMAGGDPLLLAQMTVLLPTRRAARALREAFLRLTAEGSDPGAPLLLPRLRPIGDLDDDEVDIAAEGLGDPTLALAIPPAISNLRRQLLLSRLVQQWSETSEGRRLLPGQAAALAAALARLLDAAQTDEASLAELRSLAPDDLAEHWQTVLRFLSILHQWWPAILEQEGALDPAERRNRLLRRQAELWRRNPPTAPVIAAGLTGGIPALTELISVVAWADQGAVILTGFERAWSADEWEQIAREPSHPQHLTALLLRALEIDPDAVREWPAAPPPPPRAPGDGRARRLRLVAQAMRPPGMTDEWRELPAETADALAGVSRYDCAGPQEEAVTAALLLRRALETPEQTAALITPDRELARRVAAELQRWGVDIDDSAGLPLNRTPPGAFLRLVLDMAENALAPVPLLAALKHPLAAGGLPREEFRELARRLETAIRGPRPAPGFAGLRAALGRKGALKAFVAKLEYCVGELLTLLEKEAVSLPELVASHVTAAERLAATDGESGRARLWQDAAGEAAARFCHELIDAAADYPPIAGRHYPALFEALAAGTVVRPPYGRHPRLAIWGLVEARLQQPDVAVLGGLNEGTWPGAAAHDPWMSRQMRQEFGIALPERAIGIAAHDFAQALAARSVALTRASRREGVPTVASRWLLRLETVLRAVGLEGALTADAEIAGAAALHDEVRSRRPSPAPQPRPPASARPRQLSVTQIEMWIRDPYAIYARHILRLEPLDELDVEPGRADLGIGVHAALAEFIRRHPDAVPLDAERELLEIGRESFDAILSRPGVWAFWWPRFERIARWFIAEEHVRRAELTESRSELNGRLVIPAKGGPFTITARADRIDRLTDGSLLVIDYKTGSVPSKWEIEGAIAVQLPLEGAIARDGSFDGVTGAPAGLEYWRLTGGDPAGLCCPLDNPADLIDSAVGRVIDLIDRFDDPRTPYQAVPNARLKPRFSDYFHLERIEETNDEEQW